MKPAHSVLAFVFAAATAAAQNVSTPADVELVVHLSPAQVNFTVVASETPFVGIVLVSLSPNVSHYVQGLPPLLEDAVVAAWGFTNSGRYGVSFHDSAFPPGVMIHAQGVALLEKGSIVSSNVGSFVLDVTGGGGGE
jgi:hypothetical protein